jgi:histidinol-phosphate aminotransferase
VSAPQPKKTILGIEPYRPGRAKAPGGAKAVKLSSNENALGCSPAARAAYLQAASDLHIYPDSRATALREALAQKHDLDPARIVFGAGSDEVFSLVCQAYLSPGDNMVQPHYAFAAWAIAGRAAGADVKSAPERNYVVDVDAMLAAVDERTRVMFIANPANPTGTSLPICEIERLHAALPEHVVLVLDGAYVEFSESRGREDWRFASAPNVVITRTFSKLYGLASLRVGWGYCPAPVADALNRIRLPFNLSAPAQAAAVAALADEAFSDRSAQHAIAGRAKLAQVLADVGLLPIQPSANFVTVRIPEACPLTAAAIDKVLAERGVLVRALDNYDMPDCLRITVGAEHEMRAFETALREILS